MSVDHHPLVGVMIDAHIKRLAASQDDLVAVWQLRQDGWTTKQIECRTAGLERVHDGVFRTSAAAMTDLQRWRAATLTTPDSALSHASAGALHGIRPWPRNGGSHVIITRPGSGGPERIGSLLVLRSTVLQGNTTVIDGIRLTTPERTLLDLSAAGIKDLRKATREALRKNVTTIGLLRASLDDHPRRRGSKRFRALVDRYERLRLERCRSDGEAFAVEQLDDAGLPLPEVNSLVAGHEADLYFEDLSLIIEVDGPAFHVLKDEDARKTAIWVAAGKLVRRVPSDDVFADPGLVPRIVRARIAELREDRGAARRTSIVTPREG